MPAQKRSLSVAENQNNVEDSPSNKRVLNDDQYQQQQQQQQTQQEEDEQQQQQQGEDSEESESQSDAEERPEFIFVQLKDIRKDVQCPICLGIIKKTRTVMECLHRFCRECIDKSMRLGNNECPACRTHCASRRSLRDDPNYDALISALYPDIDKYEEEELAFHEEERARNKQIQASITEIFRRQSEALVKRRVGKESTSSTMTRTRRNNRNALSRRRRNGRDAENPGSDDNEDVNDETGDQDSSSNDENNEAVGPRRRRRRLGIRPCHPSSSAANSDVVNNENELEVSRESRGISPVRVSNPELLVWGGGGARSNNRYGPTTGPNSRNARRVQKLIEHFKSLNETDELDIHLLIISLDKESVPSLNCPYLCIRPSLTVAHLCEFVSRHTPLAAEEVELYVVKAEVDSSEGPHPSFSNDQLQLLEGHQTLGEVLDGDAWFRRQYTLGYRRKGTGQ